MAQRAKRFLAVATAGMLLAGGAALTTASEASATPAHAPSISRVHHRVWHPGHWTRVWHPGHWTRRWHPAYRDNRHRQHKGYWSRTWHKGYSSRTWHRGYWS